MKSKTAQLYWRQTRMDMYMKWDLYTIRQVNQWRLTIAAFVFSLRSVSQSISFRISIIERWLLRKWSRLIPYGRKLFCGFFLREGFHSLHELCSTGDDPISLRYLHQQSYAISWVAAVEHVTTRECTHNIRPRSSPKKKYKHTKQFYPQSLSRDNMVTTSKMKDNPY